jgi:glycosyltransferase involved in cell wall biosynthesis
MQLFKERVKRMNDKKPTVSVCLVTYNQEKYIRQCLQSIVEQETDFDFEIIVGDDYSTDGTRAIVQEFADRYPDIVKPVLRGKNIGASKNYVSTHNAGTGEFIAHCDGDDLFLPKKLQSQVDYFRRNPGCSVIWHRVNCFDDAGNFCPGEAGDHSMFVDGVVTLGTALRLGTVGAHSSMMYRKSARKTIAPDFETLDLFYSWEYLCSGWGAILDDVLGEYRINASGSVSSTSRKKMRMLIAHHSNYYLQHYPEKRREIFVFALTNFLIDLKNRRKTTVDFLLLALRAISFVSIPAFLAHLKVARKMKRPVLSKKRDDACI